MASLNRATFIGNVTRDPELRRIASGNAVTDFSLAINDKWTGKDGQAKEVTEFLDFSAWGKNAETIAQYVKKGQSIYVEAKVKTDKWDDKTSGEKRSKIKFEVLGFQFLGGGKKVENQASEESQQEDSDEDSESDIPF